MIIGLLVLPLMAACGAQNSYELYDFEFIGFSSELMDNISLGDVESGSEVWVIGELIYDANYYLLDPEDASIRLSIIYHNDEQEACLSEASGHAVRIVGILGNEGEMNGVISVSRLLDSGEDNFVCYF